MTNKEKAAKYDELIKGMKRSYNYWLEVVDEQIDKYSKRYNYSRYKCGLNVEFYEGRVHELGSLLGYEFDKVQSNIDAVYSKYYENVEGESA